MTAAPAWGSIFMMGVVALVGIVLIWALFNFMSRGK